MLSRASEQVPRDSPVSGARESARRTHDELFDAVLVRGADRESRLRAQEKLSAQNVGASRLR